MAKKTIYVAGPMSGLTQLNFPAFYAAEKMLADNGWEVVNPARFSFAFGPNPEGKMLDACCEAELAAIPHLDAIALLHGWQHSKGAKRELLVALERDLDVLIQGEDF